MFFRIPDFTGQQGDEKVILKLRRHWFIFFRQAMTILVIAALPTVGVWLWKNAGDWQLVSGTLGHTALVMAGSVYYTFLWMLLYGFWLDYFLDYFIVTDKRVIDIEQSGLFSRTVAEQQLVRVQDVTHVVKGFWATMFHFGHVYIQTAGETQRFVFEDVDEPDKVAAIILQHSAKAEKTPHVPPAK